MPKYKCSFPYCDYCTTTRSKIEYHHIVPREIDPSPQNKVTVSLCPTHHRLIYYPGATVGIHAITDPSSLQIVETLKSTEGKTIHYESMDGSRFYWTPDSKIKW
jgi:hypothetical protein